MAKNTEQPDGLLAMQIAIAMLLVTVTVLVGVGLFIGWLIWA